MIDSSDQVLIARLARVAYDAYGDRAGWRNYLNTPMPPWADLGDTIRDRWCAAISGVLTSLARQENSPLAPACQCGHGDHFHDVAEADGSDRRCCVDGCTCRDSR